jgi:G3E family GTPase
MDPKRPDRMPVLVMTGFLGAGKTTFLNQLLALPRLEDSLVLVNEFGDTGLDSLFLEEEAEKREEPGTSGLLVEELTSGCFCCTLQGPLVTTLEDLLRARDNGRIAPFKQLIIETTGLADPSPILGAFARHPYLNMRYMVGGIVTVVDAAQELEALDATPEATAQIAVADVIALSKTDLVDDDAITTLKTQLRARNVHAHIAATSDLAGEPAWIATLLEQAAPPVAPTPQEHGHTHEHGHNHDHDHNHAFSTVLTTDQPLAEKIIAMFMDLIGMNLPGDVLRVKGIAWIAGETDPAPWAVHAAGPLQHPPRPISKAMQAKLEPMQSQIVIISRTDQNDRLEELFNACLKQNRA